MITMPRSCLYDIYSQVCEIANETVLRYVPRTLVAGRLVLLCGILFKGPFVRMT